MPENLKVPQSASPVARWGAGDISERELSRERHNLYATPTRRIQRVPRKHVCSATVNKFTGKSSAPSPNLARIKSCLDEYATPKRAKIGPKAASMEDLTPNRPKRDRKDRLSVVRSPGLHNASEQQAAARIGRFMLTTAWRRRREEVRCLKKTLEFQVCCSERLRTQVWALKSLLDSDNVKVRLAMRELERLKQLLKEKDIEKALLAKEKIELEQDVCAAEDRMSEISIGWRNTRNELECARAARGSAEQSLALERAAVMEAQAQRDHAYRRISVLEEDLTQHESMLATSEQEATALRRNVEERQRLLDDTCKQLKLEIQTRKRITAECRVLSERMLAKAAETAVLGDELSEVRARLTRLELELATTREQLNWWPRPLTRMLGMARCWLRQPMSVPEAVMWTLVPARHGC
ncbi:uncharacterized protein LOC123717459 [Pieris brassicae]|uniref:uncharacterized protein LOC123717459 n=1 Tax=Pieris brassicae TaxID=7116 RepID=UPI001E65F0BE|nr:uncharacterized protein LOC123717459 [Pieris brassicae]